MSLPTIRVFQAHRCQPDTLVVEAPGARPGIFHRQGDRYYRDGSLFGHPLPEAIQNYAAELDIWEYLLDTSALEVAP